MSVLVGYDIDGVLTAGIKPEGDYVVVSGRLMKAWKRTVDQIGLNAPIYLRTFGRDVDPIAAGHFKASVIALLGIQIFYEDEEAQASVIRQRCPWCEVRIVVDGKVKLT